MLIITVSLLIVVHYRRQRLRHCTGNIRILVHAGDIRTGERRLVMRYGRVSISRKIETSLRQLPKQRYGERAIMYLSDKVHSRSYNVLSRLPKKIFTIERNFADCNGVPE